MLAQSGDLFDIWGMIPNGTVPKDHGNAGNGTYIVEVGKRTGMMVLFYLNSTNLQRHTWKIFKKLI